MVAYLSLPSSEQRERGGILYQIVLNLHLEVEVEVGEEKEEEGEKRLSRELKQRWTPAILSRLVNTKNNESLLSNH